MEILLVLGDSDTLVAVLGVVGEFEGQRFPDFPFVLDLGIMEHKALQEELCDLEHV
jgi:hypothetical protein